jgi:O-antigen/teichoic acid export membrane protein
MIGYFVASMIVLASQWLLLKRGISNGSAVSRPVAGEWQRQMWAFSWPISCFGAFTWLQIASDRWALQAIASTRDVGLYAVLFQIGYYPISVATGMAMQFLAPIIFARAGDAKDSSRVSGVNHLSNRLMWLGIAITVLATGIAGLAHQEIFEVLVAKEFREVSYLLPWTVLAAGIFAAGQAVALNLMSQMRTRSMMVVKIGTAILGVALNFIGAYFYGVAGVAVAGVLFSAAYFLWILRVTK